MKKRFFVSLFIFILAILLIVFAIFQIRKKGSDREVKKITETQAQRKEREEKRKIKDGDFYVPLKDLHNPYEPKSVSAKGLYVKAHVAGYTFNEKKIDAYADYIKKMSGASKEPVDESIEDETNVLEKILGICKGTEINALVIDIKGDEGYVTWPTDIPKVAEIQKEHTLDFENYKPLLEYMKKNQIYAIARIVTFKDPYLAENYSEHAMQLKTGGTYRDGSGTPWVNPYDKFVWQYVVSIAKEAALRGFDEINFDYVRFPDNAQVYNEIVDFPGRNNKRKDDNIQDFLIYAGKELHDYKVFISADVFPVSTHNWDDTPEDIGQTWRKISRNVDIICPMVYPSHYDSGWYGFEVPDQEPYGVFKACMTEALERNASQEFVPKIRPWIQGFTANWVNGYKEYTPEVMADQIVACAELGIDEYLVWNAENKYDAMTFFYQDRVKKIFSEEQDAIGRTPQEALERFLQAQRKQNCKVEYLLTPVANRQSEYSDFEKYIKQELNRKLFKYTIEEITPINHESYEAKISGVYNSLVGVHYMESETVIIRKENGIWKVDQKYIRYEEEEVNVNPES